MLDLSLFVLLTVYTISHRISGMHFLWGSCVFGAAIVLAFMYLQSVIKDAVASAIEKSTEEIVSAINSVESAIDDLRRIYEELHEDEIFQKKMTS